MTLNLIIEAKIIGQKQKPFEDWSVPIPPESISPGDRMKLRDLITRIVIQEVEAFNQRQIDRRLIRVLSKAEIDLGVTLGKVDMGGQETEPQKADVDQAIGNALQSFEDGFYFVFIDERQYEKLDEEVYLKQNSRVTFVRLTPLVGG